MNTKYSFIAIIAMCTLLVFGSCKKYLDQQPITDVTTPAVFKDVSSTYLALVGVYSRLAGQEGYGQRLSLYYTVDTDEMQGPTGTDDERRNIARWQPTPVNTGLPNPFNQLFQGIEYANNCIDNIPKMSMYTNGTAEEKNKLKRMYGEALTLRAQFYFEAIRNWGDLPAHFSSAYNLAGATPFPFRMDRDSLYDHILADLKIAADLVPWRNELAAMGDPTDERITKGTVKAVRARIALYRGGFSLRQQTKIMERRPDYITFYQIARDECNDIITSGQHGLNPSYKDIWKNQVGKHVVTDPQAELMFQATAIGGVSAEDSRLGFYDGPRVNSLGNSAINPLVSYFYLFDSLDLRRDVTIAPYWVAADGITKLNTSTSTSTSVAVGLNPGKYRRDWNTSIAPTFTGQFLGDKWQILRYSDVLLMFAEAENEINGPTAAAYNAINMVRRRGFGKPITTPDVTVDLGGLSKVTFFNALVRERSLELGGEGIRKYDLLRWNLIATALAEAKLNLAKLATATATVNVTVNDLVCTYMARPPAYATNLPLFVYLKTGNTADDLTIFSNSLYKPAPTATPAGTVRLPWLSAQVNTTALARFATGFTPGRSELFPIPQSVRDANFNLTQNPNY
ncbi:MAG TPA: RagB/SusD family nutrient uptake outer membrane protein [Ferruginibacter sp.]|nr:RagB/SusD family nutrient uptake outer membrane protein [Ferruginibacter sp.]